jgi:membrane associated rhomboid family serine protease
MGIYDRDYTHEGYDGGGGGPRMRLKMPGITPAVKWLLIINIGVFIVESVLFGLFNRKTPNYFMMYGSVFPVSLGWSLQIWRLITYQFLHAYTRHLLGNMICLYFLGSMLEKAFGTRKFLIFYLVCGMAGGIVYPVLVGIGLLGAGPMVGASGGIFGVMTAAALLHPKRRILLFFVLPISLAVIAILFISMSVLDFLRGDNPGGECAHLCGALCGFLYIKFRPAMTNRMLQQKKGAWERKIQNERNFQGEVDRILEKVHESGIHSLTRKEKSILKEATEREQQENRRY